MGKIYDVFLDEQKIGVTELEKSDAPMGVVFGQIKFWNIVSGYDFFKQYCLKNAIDFTDAPEDKFITTNNISNLEVTDKEGVEIKGIGTNISGIDSDTFDISILGISYPFYEEEFPHHLKTYRDMFK